MNKALLSLLLIPPVVGIALYMRSLASWRPQKIMVAEGPISGIVLSNDGKTLLVQHLPPRPVGGGMSALGPETIMAFDVSGAFKLLWKRDHSLSTSPQFFSNDSKILVQPYPAKILDTHTGKTLQTNFPLGDFTMSPNGKWLAYKLPPSGMSQDGRIYLNPTRKQKMPPTWSVAAQKALGQKSDATPAVAFSPDGQTLAVGAGDKSGAHIDFYSTKTWKRTRTWSDAKPLPTNPYPSYQTIQWSPDGQFLFSGLTRVGNETGQRVWRIRDGQTVAAAILLEDMHPHLENGGRVLTYGGSDGAINLCLPPDLNNNFKRLLLLPNQTITAAALSPDGTYLLAGTQSGTLYRQRLN